ncbi:hypothetical protein KQX54_017179 [Cotesia glomerata]|uniref:Uncharacterized protein n=1 Tax=Cotesia glomerata TaxID=32391 RepID=A0AAV7I3G0_COTGL|nr:hypothetical protein KQX54_017179 [Cotesia glomerata]
MLRCRMFVIVTQGCCWWYQWCWNWYCAEPEECRTSRIKCYEIRARIFYPNIDPMFPPYYDPLGWYDSTLVHWWLEGGLILKPTKVYSLEKLLYNNLHLTFDFKTRQPSV